MKNHGFVLPTGEFWICAECGQYNAKNRELCARCGKGKSGANSVSRDAYPVRERAQLKALVGKAQIAEDVDGNTGRFIVEIQRYATRQLDDDNFVAGCKQLRDAIAELLGKKGDAEKDGMNFIYRQFHVDKKNLERVEISIMESE